MWTFLSNSWDFLDPLTFLEFTNFFKFVICFHTRNFFPTFMNFFVLSTFFYIREQLFILWKIIKIRTFFISTHNFPNSWFFQIFNLFQDREPFSIHEYFLNSSTSSVFRENKSNSRACFRFISILQINAHFLKSWTFSKFLNYLKNPWTFSDFT